ncbi:MAG: hypothetical protein HY958_02805 [Bacteroidia bacterium]|nr:hypothetical protein [Bacteroidia bacterium]
MKIFFLFITLLIITNSLAAQDFNEIFKTDKTINPADSNKLFFRIENANFFKNNEYFSALEDGYTILGTMIKPQLVFYPSHNSKLIAGIHFLKYSGKDDFTQVFPAFSFQVNVVKGLDVLMGTLYSGYNHGLIEPIYKPELHFMNNYESGIQIITHLKHFKSDLWMNWEKMIFWGDPFKEEFTVGTTNQLFLTDTGSNIRISVPLQGLAAHKGGQIDSTYGIHMQTLVNLAGGISFEYRLKQTFLKSCGVNSYFVSFNDISPYKALAYIDGYGIYSDAWVNTKYLNLSAGYWDGTYFIAPRGEPLFQSVSTKYSFFLEPHNQIILTKIGIKKEIYKDIRLELRFEGYYELYEKNFDYSYGLHIVFNRNFFLKKM